MAPNVWYGPPRHQQGSRTWYIHSLGDFRLGWSLSMLIEHGHGQIWLVRAYLGSFFEPEGGLQAPNLWYVPPRHRQGRQTWYRYSQGDSRLEWPLTMLFEHGQRPIWLVRVYFGSFFGPEEGPMAPNVRYGPPGHQQGSWTWYRHSLKDLKLGWSLTILFERGQRRIRLVWAYLGSVFWPEGSLYGPKCVVWSTQTPTR